MFAEQLVHDFGIFRRSAVAAGVAITPTPLAGYDSGNGTAVARPNFGGAIHISAGDDDFRPTIFALDHVKRKKTPQWLCGTRKMNEE